MGFRSHIKAQIKKIIGRTDTPTATTQLREALSSLPERPDAEGFYAVATSDLLPEGQGKTFSRDGHGVAVFRVGGRLFAIDDACTHEDGPLGEGALSGLTVTCPYHDWHFNIETGACLSETNRNVSCFAVRERDGFIWVGPRTRQGSQERGGLHNDGLNSPQIKV